ncbi:SWIM zinc finger domain-containing protein [Halomicroarcula sp. F13]|uniref:SWIM zinc finger domain-containing protein n=1 Tax=Haloarcula rubra TaxID=2487747 RepID=A0AAW4Q0Q5_9EURY|nr:SWIM zinc finger family protein [Halomicroarcula rubra]MBX0325829.1 SWIM zinc finger domain-containing protein [Halomicroarcula rubra]
MSNAKPTPNPLSQLAFTSRVAKRAQYEAFEFDLLGDRIRVRNGSYADPENHEYLVQIEDGVPVSCTCPADEHFEGACKHRVGVAIRRPIVDLVTDVQLRADGGEAMRPSARGEQSNSERVASVSQGEEEKTDDDCECDGLPDSVPCWPCFRDGREDFD